VSAWPTSPAPNALSFGLNYPTLVSTAQSLAQQVRSRGVARWLFQLEYVNLTRAQLAPFLALIAALRGQFNTCTFTFPSSTLAAPQGSWAGTPVVDGASQTGHAINLRGFTVGAANVVKAGDLLKFSAAKVYMATADASADGAGKVAALPIEPALVASPADGESVVSSNVPFTVALVADSYQTKAKPPFFADLSVTLQERYP